MEHLNCYFFNFLQGRMVVWRNKDGSWFSGLLALDHDDGQFFRAMEWLMFFFRPPLTSMVFQWFWQCWTITIECFLRAQPLVSMVFRWFSKFWGQWSTMVLRLTIVWMSHCKKCAKSIYDKTHILSRTCKWTSIESIWYGPYLFTPYITSQCEIHTIQQRKCLKCHVIQEETRLLYKSMQND